MRKKRDDKKHCFHHQSMMFEPVGTVSWMSVCCYCNRNCTPIVHRDPAHGAFSHLWIATVPPEVEAEVCPMRYNTVEYRAAQTSSDTRISEPDEHEHDPKN